MARSRQTYLAGSDADATRPSRPYAVLSSPSSMSDRQRPPSSPSASPMAPLFVMRLHTEVESFTPTPTPPSRTFCLPMRVTSDELSEHVWLPAAAPASYAQ